MTVTFLGFTTKFINFADLTQPQFDLLLPDAVAEVDRYEWELLGVGWQGFKDRAIENLLACQLSKINPEFLGSAGLAEFEVREAGYRVKYLSNSGGSKNNPFCDEYLRLVGLVQALTPNTSNLPACTIGVRRNVVW
jgi:hypothetical protein